MSKSKKIIKYVKDNLNKFLLILVILTFCISMRDVALGKYVTYLKESTQVVADEFFFTSNYMKIVEDGDTPPIVPVAVWNRTGIGDSVSVELRNYSNSLKYNKSGTDFFYYIDADWSISQNEIDHGELEGLIKDLTVSFLDIKKEDGDGVSKDVIGKYTTKDGESYDVRLLKGNDDFGRAIDRTQRASIRIEPTEESYTITDTIYIHVTAKIVPAIEMKNVKLYDIDTYPNTKTETGNYSEETKGVFNQEMKLIYKMGGEESTATIVHSFDISDSVTFTLGCKKLKNQGTVKVRIYYDSALIKPASGEGDPQEDPEFVPGHVYVYNPNPDPNPDDVDIHPFQWYAEYVFNEGGNIEKTFLFEAGVTKPTEEEFRNHYSVVVVSEEETPVT